jgi:acyl carrier protein
MNSKAADQGQGADVRSAVTSVTGEVLDLAEVDASKSFTAQGGDSLTALAFATRLGDELGVEIPLDIVFDAEDLQDLAEQLRQRLSD